MVKNYLDEMKSLEKIYLRIKNHAYYWLIRNSLSTPLLKEILI